MPDVHHLPAGVVRQPELLEPAVTVVLLMSKVYMTSCDPRLHGREHLLALEVELVHRGERLVELDALVRRVQVVEVHAVGLERGERRLAL